MKPHIRYITLTLAALLTAMFVMDAALASTRGKRKPLGGNVCEQGNLSKNRKAIKALIKRHNFDLSPPTYVSDRSSQVAAQGAQMVKTYVSEMKRQNSFDAKAMLCLIEAWGEVAWVDLMNHIAVANYGLLQPDYGNLILLTRKQISETKDLKGKQNLEDILFSLDYARREYSGASQ